MSVLYHKIVVTDRTWDKIIPMYLICYFWTDVVTPTIFILVHNLYVKPKFYFAPKNSKDGY